MHVDEVLFVLIHWTPRAILVILVLRLLRSLLLVCWRCIFVLSRIFVRPFDENIGVNHFWTSFSLPFRNENCSIFLLLLAFLSILSQSKPIRQHFHFNFWHYQIHWSLFLFYGTWCKWTRTNNSRRFPALPRRLPLRVRRFLASLTLGKNVGEFPWQSKILHLIDT